MNSYCSNQDCFRNSESIYFSFTLNFLDILIRYFKVLYFVFWGGLCLEIRVNVFGKG